MMNCQSDACASSIARVAWARTARGLGPPLSAFGATAQYACSSAHNRCHVQVVWSFSHIEKSPFLPHEPSVSWIVGLVLALAVTCCLAVTGRTPLWERRRYSCAMKSTPSNHQCPKSSASNGAVTTGGGAPRAGSSCCTRAAVRGCHAIRDVRRALAGSRNLLDLRVPQRRAGADQMRVHEEIAVARGGEMLVGAWSIHLSQRRRHPRRIPRSSRAVRALRQPAPRRRAAEQSLVLGDTHGELQANAFVARQQRQETVRRG